MAQTPLPENLKQAIKILKRLNYHLQMGEISLKYLERNMRFQYDQPNWDQTELNTLRITIFCTVHSMLIWFNSFREEYEAGFKSAAVEYEKDKYVTLNKSCTPHFKVINDRFPHLREIRNTILAHSSRWKGNMHLVDTEIDSFMNEVTNRDSLQDYYDLYNISNLVIAEIERVFGKVNAELEIDEDIDYSS